MPEAEVIYSEVQLERVARRCTNDVAAITSSSDKTTYSEVRILESEAAAELPVSQQGAAELKGPAQVRRQDVALLVLSLLLAAAVSALAASLNNNVQTKDQLQKLQFDLEALKRNLSGQSCLKCEGGWEQHGGRCYNFSSTTSSWTKSKDNCKKQGGDLVKIDSREEQKFLQNKVGEKQKQSNDRFWIGLTDSDTEGDWRWTDGSALDKSLSFWAKDQPNNRNQEDNDGEDCVMMGEGWFDKTCKAEKRWICEKQSESGKRTVSCL